MRVFILSILLISFLGCERKEICIGVLVPLSGKNSTYGRQVLDGVKLAFEIARKEKRIPSNLELLVIDNRSSSDVTKREIKKLAEREDVIAVIGPVTSEMTLVAASFANKLKIPLITPTATNPRITKMGRWVFRLCYTDPLQGKVLARFAYESLGLKKGCILFEVNNPYSEGLARNFESTFNKLGGAVLKSYYYLRGDTLISQRVDTLLKVKPEFLFIPGYVDDVINILKILKEKKTSPILLGGDGWHSPELISEGGYLFENGFTAFISTNFSFEKASPQTRDFVETFKKNYGYQPESPSALGFDAFNLVSSIISRMKSAKREEFVSILLNVKEFEGVTGLIKFEGRRDPVRDVFISKVTPRGFEFVKKGTGK